eukprot:scaffold2339_cov54-Attheya_sp.AAC.6
MKVPRIKNFVRLWLGLAMFSVGSSSSQNGENLYELLGVKSTATTKEIKSAYRRRALETHPDKHPNKSHDEAAAEFHKVVRAFEVLTDETSRRRYDQTGQTTANQQHRQQHHQHRETQFSTFHHFFFQNGPKPKMSDQPDVREAKERLLHIISLVQLETIMLDADGLAERNLLLCFITPGEVERLANEELLFPWPFSGMSSQGIWWEDILQSVQIRFHRKGNDLTRLFEVPSLNDEMNNALTQPYLAFVKRGDPLEDFQVYYTGAGAEKEQTLSRHDAHAWVWEMLSIDVEFVNNHDHPVILYWIDGQRAREKTVIPPGGTYLSRTRLSHQWYARDQRCDNHSGAQDPLLRRKKFTKESLIGNWIILSDQQQKIVIETTCFDLSGHCTFWNGNKQECDRNSSFMHAMCPKTCNTCKNAEGTNNSRDEL